MPVPNVPYAPQAIYQPNGRLVDLIRAQGQDAARAAELRGQQQAQLWGGVGQAINQGVGNVLQATDPQRKVEAARAQIVQGQVADANALRAGQGKVDAMMAGDQLPAGDTGPRQESYLTEDGLYDITKLNKGLAAAGIGHLAPDLLKHAEDLNASITTAQEHDRKAAESKAIMLGYMASGALKLHQTVGMPLDGAIEFVARPGLAAKQIKPEELAGFKAQIGQLPPDQQVGALQQIMDHAAEIAPKKSLSKDAIETDIFGRTAASNIVPEKPTEASLAADLSSPDPAVRDRATKALAALKPPPGVTEAQLDAAQQSRLSKLAQGIPLSAEEKADTLAYQERKRTVSDPAQLAAVERQTRTINAQLAQQQRAQDFQVAQVARKDLVGVEKTFTDGKAAADMLRDTVDAAKGGNKIAAAMQNLQTAMASVKASGFNRINMAEIGIPGTAGSFLDTLASRFGKVTEGQPVPADLQKDILKFADLLEKTAYQKYSAGFDSVAKLYGLNDQQKTLKLAAPAQSGVGPKVGDTRTANGETRKWNGKEWVPQ